MKTFLLATAMALVATAADASEIYSYACRVDGEGYGTTETHLIQVDEQKHLLKWRGKTYRITIEPSCGKYGWHATGHGSSFDFCTATKGWASIDNSKGFPVASNSNAAHEGDASQADCMSSLRIE